MRRASESGGVSIFEGESTEQIRAAYEQAFPELPPEHARSLVEHVATEPGEPMDEREFLRHVDEGRIYPGWVGYHTVDGKKLWGAELLARLYTGDGFACAERFKDSATRRDMWPEISKSVMSKSAQVVKHVPEHLAVSFNVCGDLLDEGDRFVEFIAALQKESGTPDRTICLETVEQIESLLNNGRSQTLRKCEKKKVRFFVDDLGAKKKDKRSARSQETDEKNNADRLLEQLTTIVEIYGIKFCAAVTSSAQKGNARLESCIKKGKRHGVSRYIAEGSEHYPINNQMFLSLQRLQDKYEKKIELLVQGPVFRIM